MFFVDTFLRSAELPLLLIWMLTPSIPLANNEEPEGIPVEIIGRIIFVRASVNDHSPFTFIIDTGATETVVTPATAKRVGITTIGIGNKKKGTAKSIAVGNFIVRDLQVLVFDPPQALALRLDKGVNYNGILGYTFLRHFITTNNYKLS